MTAMSLDGGADLAPPVDEPNYDRNGVRRSKGGRPYVKTPCSCDGGRVPGKREGTTKACPKKCAGGVKEVLYTRCTSFVGALEDRQNLEAWQKRVVLLGIAADHAAGGPLLDDLAGLGPEDRESLDRLAEVAYEAGDGYRKARQGTSLHFLAELVDAGEPLPDYVTTADRADLAAYLRIMEAFGIKVLDSEVFVVEDDLRVGGTYDRRIVSHDERLRCPRCDAPGKPKPKVLDLKTGRIDYGGGKMRQQLALYAQSLNYDPETGERWEQHVCPHRGFILHVGQGTGEGGLHAVDLVAGWRDVQLSARVREHRRATRAGVLEPLDSGLVLNWTVNPS